MHWIAFTVFLILFVLVTVMGFIAAHWRKADLDHLHEWGLGGRRFGTEVTWFLLGGDVYTAYTFIAVPALVFGAGALGFFALPYTIVVYPLVFLVLPRLWQVAHKHNYVTGADFIRGRYDSPTLALLIAVTGILATLPYIALQLVGMEVIIAGLGFPMTGWAADLPLIVAFVILAAYTYTSGLRAPALISVVKDLLIYITIIAAMVVIPMQLGGFGKIFSSVAASKVLLAVPKPDSFGSYSAFASLAFGSALALFAYPHTLTGVMAAKDGRTIKRNMAFLPAYTFALGLIALLGFMAVAAGVGARPEFAPYFKQYASSFAVPALFLQSFPEWFTGVAFAAIVIGALVPAAIMSIAAANLFTRNIYKEYINPKASNKQESNMAKVISLVLKFIALIFVLELPNVYAIQFQLLGGIWISQIIPATVFGLYTRWFHRGALILGWLVGMVAGTWMAASTHFGSSIFVVHLLGYEIPAYAALYALLANIVVAAVFTPVFRGMKLPEGRDATAPGDYQEG